MTEDFAVAEGDFALGEASHLGVVGHHDDGVTVAVQVLEEFGNDCLVGCVEIAGGLVGEKDGVGC